MENFKLMLEKYGLPLKDFALESDSNEQSEQEEGIQKSTFMEDLRIEKLHKKIQYCSLNELENVFEQHVQEIRAVRPLNEEEEHYLFVMFTVAQAEKPEGSRLERVIDLGHQEVSTPQVLLPKTRGGCPGTGAV